MPREKQGPRRPRWHRPAAKDRDRRRPKPDSKSENGRNEERKLERENNDKAGRDGDGRNSHRERRQERRDDDSSDDSPAVNKKQQSNQNNQDSNNSDGDEDTAGGNDDTTTGGNEDTTDGGGRGDGGGNDAGNAGSGFFDSPLATKARRRANDFDNAGGEDEDDGTFADVDPDGESLFETESVSLTTGPEGLEIVTNNITYFAEPAAAGTVAQGWSCPSANLVSPLEDFPFGDMAVTTSPTEPEPSDPGDTGAAPRRTEPIPAADEPEPSSSDGGDNTMDFELNVSAAGDLNTKLDLSPDELLSTTRSVRRRLDLMRPVDLA